jgi:acetyltransferase
MDEDARGRRHDDEELLVEQRTWRDGTPVLLWRLLPSTAARCGGVLRPVGAGALPPLPHRRPALDDRMLDVLVDGVDGVDHVALVVLALLGTTSSSSWRSSADPLQARPEAADVAVTVVDGWRGRASPRCFSRAAAPRPVGVTRVVTTIALDTLPRCGCSSGSDPPASSGRTRRRRGGGGVG